MWISWITRCETRGCREISQAPRGLSAAFVDEVEPERGEQVFHFAARPFIDGRPQNLENRRISIDGKTRIIQVLLCLTGQGVGDEPHTLPGLQREQAQERVHQV